MQLDKPLIAVADLKNRWGLHPESIRRYIRSGRLPAIRFGGRLRVNLEAVEAFEDSNRVAVNREAL